MIKYELLLTSNWVLRFAILLPYAIQFVLCLLVTRLGCFVVNQQSDALFPLNSNDTLGTILGHQPCVHQDFWPSNFFLSLWVVDILEILMISTGRWWCLLLDSAARWWRCLWSVYVWSKKKAVFSIIVYPREAEDRMMIICEIDVHRAWSAVIKMTNQINQIYVLYILFYSLR